MRLICPNCDAEYEVDGDLIPSEGRDVQCSNCNHTWYFQNDQEEETSAEEEVASSRPPIDPDALGIIHEEVEREVQAREAEASVLETQTDLGLDEVESATSSQLKAMLAEQELAAEEDEDDEPALAAAPSREETAAKRGIFPDIDEINSTLSDESEDGQGDEEAGDRARSGFRLGFFTIILLFAIFVLIYAFAPMISERVPAMAGPVANIVAMIDALRVWIDGATRGLVEQITAITG